MEYTESLRKTREFKVVYEHGKSFANKYLVMYVYRNGMDRNRIGISVSKKVGNSVKRHRITRLIRESYRLHESRFEKGLDLIVIARVRVAQKGYGEVSKALLHLGSLHRILQKAQEDRCGELRDAREETGLL